MKKLKILLCSVALTLSVTAVASAIPIGGKLYLASIAKDSSFNLATATDLPSMTSFAWGTKGLAPLAGTWITTNAFTFNPTSTPAANPLWTASGFSFILNSVSITKQSVDHLSLTGLGTLSSTIPGLDDTIYTWGIKINKWKVAVSFMESKGPVPVPEPATMLLLGTGLAGLVAVVRRRKVSKA